MAWITKKLKELGAIVGGGTPSTKHPEYYTSNGIGWITPKDLSGYRGRFISHGERDISSDGLAHSSARLMPKGTVLFSSRAPIGYVAIAGNDLCTNQGFKSIVPNESTDSEFLYYLMLHNASKIEAIAGGSTFKEVSGSVLGDFSVMVPDSLDEQHSIASVLSSLDSKIELNNRINDNLSKQAEAIFEGVFAESMYGDKKISDFILPKRGKPLLSKDAIAGDVPVVAGGLEPATFHNVANTVAPVITISASGANAGFVRLWNVPVWSSDSSFIDKTMTDMVYFWYLVLKTRQDEIYGVQTGSAQPHVYPQNVGSLPIDELDQVKAKEVNTLLTPLFEKIGENELENQRLASLRDSLLPRLLNGEISLAE